MSEMLDLSNQMSPKYQDIYFYNIEHKWKYHNGCLTNERPKHFIAPSFPFSERFQQWRLYLQGGPGEDSKQADPQRADWGRGEDGVWEGDQRDRPGQRWTSVTGGLPAHDCSSSRLPQVGQW